MEFAYYTKFKKCQLEFLFSLFVMVSLILLCNVNLTFAIDSQPTEKSLVVPANVFNAVQELNQDIETLRRHMGADRAALMDIHVSRAAPQDVYFQALTMLNKANRLSFEITRQQSLPPSIPQKKIFPSHVIILVENAHEVLKNILENFKIHQIHSKRKLDFSKTPSDVFKLIMLTNRQLNLLLERRFSPSDVYLRTMLAIGYSARLLSHYTSSLRIPKAPHFESNKTPIDVYLRFLNCLDIISQIYHNVGFKALDINTDNINHNAITPSDVFDIASLVVARLDFLHKNIGLNKKPREVFYPGRKYPSDVYQYVGILEKQLKQIKLAVAKIR